MARKVYWVSRHELSPAQKLAVRELHGQDVEIVKDPAVFSNTDGLAEYIRDHSDGFVYAVAGAPHYLAAALAGCNFGVFENHQQKRQDGTFGLAGVYHVSMYPVVDALDTLHRTIFSGSLQKVWSNPDPQSDQGESLVPVSR